MKTFAITFIAIIAFAFASCDKGDMEIKKLNRGEGVWTIESIQTDTYDSLGVNVVSTVTQTDIGEFVFFNNTTLNGLYDEHFLTLHIKDTNGIVSAYPGGVYYDDNRVKISETGSGIDGVWTVDDNGRRKQEWSIYSVRPSGTLATKSILKMKKK
jgi:hypothetical protein